MYCWWPLEGTKLRVVSSGLCKHSWTCPPEQMSGKFSLYTCRRNCRATRYSYLQHYYIMSSFSPCNLVVAVFLSTAVCKILLFHTLDYPGQHQISFLMFIQSLKWYIMVVSIFLSLVMQTMYFIFCQAPACSCILSIFFVVCLLIID